MKRRIKRTTLRGRAKSAGTRRTRRHTHQGVFEALAEFLGMSGHTHHRRHRRKATGDTGRRKKTTEVSRAKRVVARTARRSTRYAF